MRNQIACFVLFLFVFNSSLWAAGSANGASADSYFKGAQDMYENGAFMPCVDLCYQAISIKKDRRYYILLGHALKDVENRKLSYRAFKDALNLIITEAGSSNSGHKTNVEEVLLKDDDYTGLLPLLVSQSIDLRKFDETKELIGRYKAYDADSARMSSERLYLEMGRLKLESGMYASAYRHYAKAANYSTTKIRSKRGCANALSGLAISLEESGENPAKLLSVLLRLYRFRDNDDTVIRIQAAFIRAGKPAEKKEIVEKITKAAN